jgi:hypothetical protein
MPAKRYDWDRWFSRDKFSLMRGRDYYCLPHGMAQMIRNAAAARGKKVSIAIKESGDILVSVRSNHK